MEARSFPTEIAEANAEFTENRIVKRIKVEGNASIQKEPEEKKIQKKKEQKLKKKFNRTQKPIRAGFQEVSPAKFLNPCKLYRYYSDFVIYEEDQSFYMCPDLYNLFKVFSKVTVSTKYSMLQVHLQESKSFNSPPVEYTIERWKSFGNKEALEWANLIKKHCDSFLSNYHNVYRFITQMPAQIRLQNEEVALNLMKNFSVIGAKNYITKDGFMNEEFTVSDKFLQLIGFPREKYISYALKFGYLNWLYHQSRFQRVQMEFYMKNLFELKEHRYESMETENIIINFKRKKGMPVFSKGYMLTGMDGNRPYIWTLIAYTVNPTKKEVDLPVFHDVSIENPLDKADEVADKQKLFDFLTTYYNANYPREAELLEKNRCKIRYLDQKNDVIKLEVGDIKAENDDKKVMVNNSPNLYLSTSNSLASSRE